MFPILSFAQANPVLTGAQAGADLSQQLTKNQYLAPQLAEALKQAQLKTQIMQPQAQYAPQMAQASLQAQQMIPALRAAQIKETMAHLPVLAAQAGAEHARTGLYGAQTQEALIGVAKSQQMMNMLRDAMSEGTTLPQTQPSPIPVSSPDQLPQSTDVQSPIAKFLREQQSTTGMTMAPQDQGSALQQLTPAIASQIAPQPQAPQPQMQQQPSPYLSGLNLTPQQIKMQRVADVLGMMSGKAVPSVQIQQQAQMPDLREQAKTNYAYQQAQQSGQAKSMNDLAINASNARIQALSNMQNLDEITKSTKDADIKGRWASLAPSIAMWDPNYVAAMKNQMQLQLGQVKDLGGSGIGRILEREVEMIGKGTPSPDLPPEAVKILAQQMKIANKAIIARAELLNKYKDQIPDPARLNTAIGSVLMANNPVDENGNIDESKIDAINKYATPQLMHAEANPLMYGDEQLQAIRNDAHGKAYSLPNGLSEDDVVYNMKKYGKTRAQILDKFKARQGK